MANLRKPIDVGAEVDIAKLVKLTSMIPGVSGTYLGIIGKDARLMLKKKYLSGQEIDLRVYPLDKRKYHTVTSQISKNNSFVRIYSYPVNLFEKGRKLPNGQREPGKFIITKKLKSDVNSKMAGYKSTFERVLQKEIDKRVD